MSQSVSPCHCPHAVASHRKVYERLVDDFGTKRRERVVRLDVPMQAFQPQGGTGGRGGRGQQQQQQQALQGVANAAGGLVIPGLDQYCAALRDSVRVCFEARQSAYAAEVRQQS
jgi:hypothetical protein